MASLHASCPTHLLSPHITAHNVCFVVMTQQLGVFPSFILDSTQFQYHCCITAPKDWPCLPHAVSRPGTSMCDTDLLPHGNWQLQWRCQMQIAYSENVGLDVTNPRPTAAGEPKVLVAIAQDLTHACYTQAENKLLASGRGMHVSTFCI